MSLIVKECLKHYFFEKGSLDGLEDTRHYKPNMELAKKMNKDIHEFLFIQLGYGGHEFLTAYQLYSLRSAYTSGDMEYVRNVLNMESDEEIIKSLTSTGLKTPMKLIGGRKFKYPDLVKLLSEYFKTSQDLRVTGDGGISYGFLDYLNYVISSVEPIKLDSYIHKKDFKQIVDGLFPEIVYNDSIDKPIIEMRKLYVPFSISKKDIAQLHLDVIDNIIFNGSKLDLEDFLELKHLYNNYLLLLSIKRNKNLNCILEMANALNLTVKELLESCNFNYIDILKQIDDMHCAVVGVEGGVKIYPYTLEENENRYITCNVEDLAYLYAHDLLKSLKFLGDYAYVELPGNRVPVSTLFVADKRNNFIRG